MDSKIQNSQDADAVGKSLANIAEQQFNLLATYQVTDQLMLGGRANYQSDMDLGGTASNGNKLPSEWTFDVLGEYQVADNALIRAGINNITDEIIYDAGYQSNTPFTYVAPGREFTLALDMKF